MSNFSIFFLFSLLLINDMFHCWFDFFAVLFEIGTHRTFPTWNILAYNAIGGSGDELYGVEPMSYYIRNLTLNMSISWPLAVAAPILWFRESMYSPGSISEKTVRTGVLILPSVLWLGILFSRPHKVLQQPVTSFYTQNET